MYKGNWIHPSDNVMIDFSKLRIYGTLIHRHQALGQDKTWFDSRRQMWIRQQNNEKNRKKKFHGKVEITYQIRTPCCMSHDPRFQSFFSHHFSIGFFFMPSTFEFLFFFWELKRLSIGLATCLSIHDYRLNIVWNLIWFSHSF